MYAVHVLCDADACQLAVTIRKEWTLDQVITAYSLFGEGGGHE